jgi:hypothetical protein
METISNPQPTQFEQALAEALLLGDLLQLKVLREQWRNAKFEARELSGAGFFLSIAISNSSPRAEPPNFELSDVYFEAKGLPYGGGAVLFVRNGAISMLEAYSHAGGWPGEITDFTLQYFDGERRNTAAVEAEIRSRSNRLAT